jgi:TrmH family RNA methyltransferase
MITSPANPKLRYVRHLGRRAFRAREGRVALEGLRLVADAVAAGRDVAFALVTPEAQAAPATAALLERIHATGAPVLPVAPALFDAVCDTATPQGVLAVVEARPLPWPEPADLVLVLDGVRDPGNVGTALRSALAAGADAALLAPGTADATQPKALRAGMGAQLRLPYAAAGWEEIGRRTAGLALWVAEAGGERAYTEPDWRRPAAIVVGGEAAGPSAQALAVAAGTVRIPMAEGAESLNAAMAATVLLFEARRQRQGAPPVVV